jgi:predicted oxidoreductase
VNHPVSDPDRGGKLIAMDADVIVVGAGLAGLVATHELTSRGKKVAVVDQEKNAANLGGQAFWSFASGCSARGRLVPSRHSSNPARTSSSPTPSNSSSSGGGGAHGYSALEGTFLGGCLFSGRAAGRDLTHRL